MTMFHLQAEEWVTERSWEVQLTDSSPGYPQTNGMAERTSQTIESMFHKMAALGLDPYLALLELGNAPLTGTEYSPHAWLLMGKMSRTTL